MPELYPYPNSTETSGFFEVTKYINGLVDGWFAVMFVFLVFIITFIATKNFETQRAFAIASFLAFVISVPMAVLELISPRFMYLFLLLLGFALVYLKLETGRVA